jgi:outer membrane autotransporter protein
VVNRKLPFFYSNFNFVHTTYIFCDTFLLGLTGSVGRAHFHWDQGRGHGGISHYQMGLYGSWMSQAKTWYVDLAGFVGRNRFNSYRKIKFPGLSRTAKQHHWGTDYALVSEVGYMFYLPQHWSVKPYIQGGYLWLTEQAFKEHGAGGLNMTIHRKLSRYGHIGPGIEVAQILTKCNWIFRPAMRMGYIYRRSVQGTSNSTASLTGQPGSFVVRGTSKGRHRWTGGLSLAALSKNGLFIQGVYNAEVARRYQSHEGLLRLGWKC